MEQRTDTQLCGLKCELASSPRPGRISAVTMSFYCERVATQQTTHGTKGPCGLTHRANNLSGLAKRLNDMRGNT